VVGLFYQAFFIGRFSVLVVVEAASSESFAGRRQRRLHVVPDARRRRAGRIRYVQLFVDSNVP